MSRISIGVVSNYFDNLHKRHVVYLCGVKQIIFTHNIRPVHKAMSFVDQDCTVNKIAEL